MPSVYVKTLGCKVNTFDSHALENQFKTQGYKLLDSPNEADVTVVNTCSVTANADREARYLARRLRRENPKTVLVFTGCYAQTDSANLVAMDEIDVVVPNEVKDQLVGIVAARLLRHDFDEAATAGKIATKLPQGVKAVHNNRQSHFKSALTLFDRADSQQTRVFLKIQDGCDGFCSYCLIPYARGASRSVAPELIVTEVERLVKTGCREVVLTGIHIGDYGRDLPQFHGDERPIIPLLKSLFAVLDRARLRISSLEPSELSRPLLELLASERARFCEHFHLPLQAGHDRILKLMRRAYDSAEYAATVAMIREYFPKASIGADVIPGFPGESDAEFAATLAFIEQLQLSYLHVFPYSKRPNTAAARLPGHLDGSTIKHRAARLRSLSQNLTTAYSRQFIGQTLPVLWEKDCDSAGRRLGHSSNYLNVVAPGAATLAPGSLSLTSIKGFVEQGRLLGLPL